MSKNVLEAEARYGRELALRLRLKEREQQTTQPADARAVRPYIGANF